jgi:hypothetical protein
MSWSVTKTITPNELPTDEMPGDLEEAVKGQNPAGIDAATDAWGAVIGLLRTGNLGTPDKQYFVSMSGHGNPGHEPTPGWANDEVRITIQQAPPTPV